MALVTNVFRRGATYYFRVRVPPNFRELLGRRELWRSLRTSVPEQARHRAARLCTLTLGLWAALEQAMTPEDAQPLINGWLLAKLDEDANLRDLPQGARHEVLVFRRTDAISPDVVVTTLTRAEADRLAQEAPNPNYSGDAGFGEFGWSFSGLAREGEFHATDMSDADIARQAFRKPHLGAPGRHRSGDDTVARPLVRAVLVHAGVTVDESDPAFTAAVRFMMRAQADLAEQYRARDVAGR